LKNEEEEEEVRPSVPNRSFAKIYDKPLSDEQKENIIKFLMTYGKSTRLKRNTLDMYCEQNNLDLYKDIPLEVSAKPNRVQALNEELIDSDLIATPISQREKNREMPNSKNRSKRYATKREENAVQKGQRKTHVEDRRKQRTSMKTRTDTDESDHISMEQKSAMLRYNAEKKELKKNSNINVLAIKARQSSISVSKKARSEIKCSPTEPSPSLPFAEENETKQTVSINKRDEPVYRNGELVHANGFTTSESTKFREQCRLKRRNKLVQKKLRKSNPQTQSGTVNQIVDLMAQDDPEAADFISFLDGVIRAYIDSAKHIIPKELFKYGAKDYRMLCYRFYSLYRATSAMDYTIVFCDIADYFGVLDSVIGIITKFVEDNITLLIKWSRDTLRTQVGTTLDKIHTFLELLIESDLVSAIKDLFSLIAKHIFNFNEFSEVFDSVFSAGKTSMIGLIAATIKAIDIVYKIGKSIYNGVPWTRAILATDVVVESFRQLELIRANRNIVYFGAPKQNYITAAQYAKESNDSLKFVETVLKTASPAKSATHKLRLLYTTVMSEYTEWKSQVAGVTRTAPLAVLLTGLPGIGKLHILKYICKMWNTYRNRKHDMCYVFPRNTTSQYWDGYDPISHPIIHYSEVAKSSTSIAKTKLDEAFAELLSVIDGNAYRVNTAFEDKGKVHANPELVICDTNNSNLNLKEQFFCQDAYRRRFLYVEVVVKNKYKKSGGGIDVAKAMSYPDEHPLDKYLFKVYSYDGASQVIHVDYKPLDIFTEYMMEYFHKETKKRTRSNTIDDSPLYFPPGSSYDPGGDSDDPHGDDDDVNHQHPPHTDCHSYMYEDVYPKSDSDVPCRLEEKYPEEYLVRTDSTIQLQSGIFQPIYNWTIKKVKNIFTEYIVMSFYMMALSYIRYLLYSTLYTILEIPDEAYIVIDPLRLLLLCLSIYSFGFRIIVFVPLFFINYGRYLSDWARSKARYLANHFNMRSAWHRQHAFSIFREGTFNPFMAYDDNTRIYSMFLITTVLFLVAYNRKALNSIFFKKKSRSGIAQSGDVADNEYYTTYEREQYGAGVHNKRIPVQGTKIWNEMETFSQTPFTGDIANLSEAVKKNVRFALISSSSISKPKTTYILGIKGNKALINKHALGKDRLVTISVSNSSIHTSDNSGFKEHVIDATTCIQVTDDVVIVELSSMRFRNITSHFISSTFKPSINILDGIIKDTRTKITYYPNTSVEVTDSIMGKLVIKGFATCNMRHQAGDCGLPLVAKVNDRGAILGIHFAGAFAGEAFTKIVTQEDITRSLSDSLDQFEVLSQCAYTQSGEYIDITKRPLKMPGRKSLTRFMHLKDTTYVGTIPKAVILPSRSRVVKTKIHDRVKAFFEDHDMPPGDYGPPLMTAKYVDGQYLNPFNIAMEVIQRKRKVLNPIVCDRVVEYLSRRIINMLEVRDVFHISPLTSIEAINGIDSDPFTRSMNFNASGGFDFSGPKKKYLPLLDDGKRYMTKDLRTIVDQCLANYESGISNNFVYSASLKDEPLPKRKRDLGKTRVFCMSSLPNLIISRMFLSSFYTLMVEHGDIFGTFIGINMDTQSHEMYTKLKDFSENILEGDYKNYDKSMPVEVAYMVSKIIYNVCKHLGYNDSALRCLRGILTDNIYVYIEMLQDIFLCVGIQPSGKYGTAEDNSLRGICLLLYAWFYSDFDAEYGDFFENIMPGTYGDDILAAVKPIKFNNLFYQSFCREHYGMDFTSSDKSEIMKPFLNPDEMSFLKRTFVYSNFNSRYVSRLSHDSISRSLMWTIPSSNITMEDQILYTSISAMYSFSVGYEDLAEDFRNFIIGAISSEYDIPSTILDGKIPHMWEICNRIFNVDASVIGLDVLDRGLELAFYKCHSDVFTSTADNKEPIATTECGVSSDHAVYRAATLLDYIEMLKVEEKELELEIKDSEYYSIVFESDKHYTDVLRERPEFVPTEFYTKVCRYFDVRATLRSLTRSPFTQSGEMEVGAMEHVQAHQNIVDDAGDEQVQDDAGSSYYPNSGVDDKLNVAKYLERPVLVGSLSLPTGTEVFTNYKIWNLWSLKPSVRAKLRNYSYFKGDLNLRIAISGSPFHYGRVLISYQPYNDSNSVLGKLLSMNLTYSDMRPLVINYLSQSEGAITMDVKANEPVEMKIPFISPKPMFRLYNESAAALSAVTPYDDFLYAGAIYVIGINPVAAVSATPSTVYMQIYAWATDVNLGQPTATQIEITTESGEDEFERGPVEKFSSGAQEISKALETVPMLMPFAKASTMFFGALRLISSHFGWSTPPVIDSPVFVKNDPYVNGAHTMGSQTVLRLTLDPKQELSIDPRIGGVQRDEMSISDIASRRTYLTTFDWLDSTPARTPLWLCRNQPILNTIAYNGINHWQQPTAMSFAALPFKYWNGSITYTFQIVCSAFHRGKLMIIFEPNVVQYSLINANLSTNKQYMIIVDIQDSQEFDITVDWSKPQMWNVMPASTTVSQYGTSTINTTSSTTNGYIIVCPYTPLQSPDNSDVPINVYVRSNNLKVNQLLSDNLPTARKLRTESGVFCKEISHEVINCDSSSLDRCSELYFGERPVSFRALLKRYTTSSIYSITIGTLATHAYGYLIDRIFPINNLPLDATAPIDSRVSPLMTYLQYAFMGAKGGIRKRLTTNGFSDASVTNSLWRVSLVSPGTSETTSTGITTSSVPTSKLIGTSSFITSSNAGVEVELPYYSNNLFWFAFSDSASGYLPTDQYENSWTRMYTLEFQIRGGTYSVPSYISVDTSTGEDFMLFRYQGAPYYTH